MSKETQDFLRTHSKTHNDVRVINQSDYLDYMKTHQDLPKTVLESVVNAEKKVIAAATDLTTEDLVVKMARAKEAGEDPTEEHAETRINRPGGQYKVIVQAKSVKPNPQARLQNPDEPPQKVTNYGVVRVRANTDSMIDDEAAARARDTISKLIGGTE